jgi:hypothetical protein
MTSQPLASKEISVWKKGAEKTEQAPPAAIPFAENLVRSNQPAQSTRSVTHAQHANRG